MKYFSTFSGIGGFELGIQQAYANQSNNGLTTNKLPETEGVLQVGDKPNNNSGNGNGGWTNQSRSSTNQ